MFFAIESACIFFFELAKFDKSIAIQFYFFILCDIIPAIMPIIIKAGIEMAIKGSQRTVSFHADRSNPSAP